MGRRIVDSGNKAKVIRATSLLLAHCGFTTVTGSLVPQVQDLPDLANVYTSSGTLLT